MSTMLMVFGLILVLASITILSRQNIKRLSRQRKLVSVLEKFKEVAEKA